MAMPLWRRGPGGEHPHTLAPATAAVVEPAAAAAAEPPPGDLPCAATGCAETTGVRCAYVDRRERGCATAWCPAHRELAGGHVYCRRHAVLIRAIAAGAGVPWLPDVDSRAPSLVEWLANDLGDRLCDALMATGEGDSVTTEVVHLVHAGRDRERIWERSWRLCRHTGFVHRVALQVAEERDTEVVVRVGHRELARMTPPWIEARRNGEVLTDAEDASRRAEFHDALLGAVRRGLAADTFSGA
jgi:hypothetical protein